MTPGRHQAIIWTTAGVLLIELLGTNFSEIVIEIQTFSLKKIRLKMRPRQNGRHFPDDIFKWIFLNENIWISIKISLTFIPRGPINNIPTLVQVMAWCQPGDKPLSEPMVVNLLTHICVTRPQWVTCTITIHYCIMEPIAVYIIGNYVYMAC